MSESASDRRLRQAELDFDTDDQTIQKEGIPCPVEWCDAHVLRYAPCGDGNPFVGVHVGRVNARKARKAVVSRRVEAFGLEGAWVCQSLEDARNMGLVPIETDAQRRQKRARKGMKHLMETETTGEATD